MQTLLLSFFLLLGGGDPGQGRSDKAARPDLTRPDVVRPEPLYRQADAGLDDLLRQASAGDEPTLRVFLRLKIAAYLRSHPSDSIDVKAVAAEALADLDEHEKEIPPLYVNLFRRELLAQLKAHAPAAAAQQASETRRSGGTDFEVAYSMLNQAGGAEKAVGVVRRGIAAGAEPGPVIVFFLRRLDGAMPAEVPGVLDALISAEESRPGFIPAVSMFALKHLYVREQTPQALQRRYLTALVSRARAPEAGADAVVDIYTALSNALPALERHAPELYALAHVRLAQLAARMPQGTLERFSVEKRVSQSADPLAQLLVEADAARDQTLREDLLVRAAQMSLEKGQPRAAIELAAKLQPKTAEARLWRDQFVEGAVERALEGADIKSARCGADQIESACGRSSALQKIALYLQASGDPVGAREALAAAHKAVDAVADRVDKAAALLELAGTYARVDGHRAPELVREAVNAINESSPRGWKTDDGGRAGHADVESMMKLAYTLIPAFQEIGARDQYEAAELARGIKRQELRLVATFALQTGQPGDGTRLQGVASR